MAVQETATELGTNQWVWLHAAKAVSCKNIPWASQAALGVLWSNSIKAIAVLQWICATETWLWSGHEVRLSGKKRKKVLGVKTIKGKAPGTFCTGSEYSRPASAWGFTAPTATVLLGLAAGQSLSRGQCWPDCWPGKQTIHTSLSGYFPGLASINPDGLGSMLHLFLDTQFSSCHV